MTNTRALLIGWSFVLSLIAARPAVAIFVDFEDLSPASYSNGGTFVSGGIQFDVVPYGDPGSTLVVLDVATNTFLSMSSKLGVDVTLPSGVTSVAFDFRDGCTPCGDIGITVNGVASSPTVQLLDLDNTSLGGVQINVLPAIQPGFHGRLELLGPITSFVTGGTEYSIDNLAILVPEPSTAGLWMAATLAAAFLRVPCALRVSKSAATRRQVAKNNR